MRRRLVAALVGVAVATLLLYAGPRTFMISGMVREREELGLERTADLIAEAIELRRSSGLDTTAADLEQLLRERDDLQLDLELEDGSRLQAGSVSSGESTARELADGSIVRLHLSASAVDRRVADALVPVVAFGVLSVLFATGVALLVSRRLSRPFAELATHADRPDIEDGTSAPRSGVPEADQIAEALDRSRRRIDDMLRREREFSSNASHQLRTPLAALRLRIEDLTTWPEVGDEVRAELSSALSEVDRLADTVSDLLELARSGGIGGWGELDLEATVAEAAARWQERFEEAGRRLHVAPGAGAGPVTGSDRAVHHVLDVLLENALSHGRGVVDVSVHDEDATGVVRVCDEGSFDRAMTTRAFERRARSASSGGSGIGLDLARTIAESGGARLRLASHEPTVFELVLPHQAGDARP